MLMAMGRQANVIIGGGKQPKCFLMFEKHVMIYFGCCVAVRVDENIPATLI